MNNVLYMYSVVEAMGHEHVVEAMRHEHVVEAMGHEHVVEAMGHGGHGTRRPWDMSM